MAAIVYIPADFTLALLLLLVFELCRPNIRPEEYNLLQIIARNELILAITLPLMELAVWILVFVTFGWMTSEWLLFLMSCVAVLFFDACWKTYDACKEVEALRFWETFVIFLFDYSIWWYIFATWLGLMGWTEYDTVLAVNHALDHLKEGLGNGTGTGMEEMMGVIGGELAGPFYLQHLMAGVSQRWQFYWVEFGVLYLFRRRLRL